MARGNESCSVYEIREKLLAFEVNPFVKKQLCKRKSQLQHIIWSTKTTVSCYCLIPISKIYRVKYMKVKILGA